MEYRLKILRPQCLDCNACGGCYIGINCQAGSRFCEKQNSSFSRWSWENLTLRSTYSTMNYLTRESSL